VTSCSFSPDGQYILSSSMDKTLKLWDLSLAFVNTSFFLGLTREVVASCFLPDKKTVASCALDDMKLWDAKSGIEKYAGKDMFIQRVVSCEFFPNTQLAVCYVIGGTDTLLKVINTSDSLQISSLGDYFGMRNTVNAHLCQISPNGKWIVSLSDSTDNINLWGVDSTVQQICIANKAKAFAFTPDSQHILYACLDTTLAGEKEFFFELYDIACDFAKKIPIYGFETVFSCFFSPTGQIIGIHSKQGVDFFSATNYIKLFYLETDFEFDYTLNLPLLQDVFCSNDKIVVAAPGALHMADLTTNKAHTFFSDPSATVVSVRVIDAQHICSAMKNEIIIWDFETCSLVNRYPTRRDLSCFSNSGYDFVLGYGNGEIDFLTYCSYLE